MAHENSTEERKVILVDDELDHAAFFEQASQCSRAQRLRTLLVFGATIFLCYFYVVPKLPALPVELTRDGLRTPTQRFRHHHRPMGQRPCPHAESKEHHAGYLNNARIAMQEMGISSIDALLDPGAVEKYFEKLFMAVPSAESARKTLEGLTKVTHVAGTPADYNTALSVLKQWGGLLGAELPEDPKEAVHDAGSSESIKLMTSTRKTDEESHHGHHSTAQVHPLGAPQVWIDTYSIWLNYPVSSSLRLFKGDDLTTEPVFIASLKEDVLEKDPTSGEGFPTFHGYSKSGKVSGQFVYAALCTERDFDRLDELGVDVEGKVTICRYGGQFRGLKVRESAKRGAVGCLIYTDPAEDSVRLLDNADSYYPQGPARHPSSVQRGSVQVLSLLPGDPSTPNTPSWRNATRISLDDAKNLPKIPSLPISYRDVTPFLKALQGSGKKASEVGEGWQGAIPELGEDYWTGPSEYTLWLDNQMSDYSDLKDIYNVYARIPGVVEEEVVVLSGHLDAWGKGAGDPSSGTAATHEVVAAVGALIKKGWRPLRTILIAGWDAEEYGLVGSTEAAEDYPDFFKDRAAIFLNMDVAVSGSKAHATSSPSLIDLIVNAAADVRAPYGNGTSLSIEEPGAVGSGSDYTAYLQHLGIASVDMGFKGAAGDPVYHYHSNYDSFYWMNEFGDPKFERHLAAAQWLGLAALRSAQSLLLPIDIARYADMLQSYLEKIQKIAPKDLDLGNLAHAISLVRSAAKSFDGERAKVTEKIKRLLSRPGQDPHSRSKRGEITRLFAEIRSMNKRAKSFETNFLSGDGKGLVGRPFYQHLVVAPGRNLGYGSTTFPGLTESITLDGGEGTKKELERLIEVLHKVAKGLKA